MLKSANIEKNAIFIFGKKIPLIVFELGFLVGSTAAFLGFLSQLLHGSEGKPGLRVVSILGIICISLQVVLIVALKIVKRLKRLSTQR